MAELLIFYQQTVFHDQMDHPVYPRLSLLTILNLASLLSNFPLSGNEAPCGEQVIRPKRVEREEKCIFVLHDIEAPSILVPSHS